MVTITERVKPHLEQLATLAPELDFCVHIFWSGETSDNFRSPDGDTVWTKVPARGWLVTELPFPPPEEIKLQTFNISGVNICINLKAPAPFPGGTVDVKNGHLDLAP